MHLTTGAGRCGLLMLLDESRNALAVLDVEQWCSELVQVEGVINPADPERWTGARALADALDVPLTRGRVPAGGRELTPEPSTELASKLSLALGLTAPLWVATALVGAERAQQVVLVVSAALAAALLVLLREPSSLPPAHLLRPAPGVPVPRRFRREALIALVPPTGPAEGVAVRGVGGRTLWVDGPAAPAGLRRAVISTPPGADAPERVDLLDALDRPVARLHWGEWFAASPDGLRVLAEHGIAVSSETGPAFSAAAARGLMWPRAEERGEKDPPFGPGLLGPRAFGLSLALTVGPLLHGRSDLTRSLGAVIGLLTLGPIVVWLVRSARP